MVDALWHGDTGSVAAVCFRHWHNESDGMCCNCGGCLPALTVIQETYAAYV